MPKDNINAIELFNSFLDELPQEPSDNNGIWSNGFEILTKAYSIFIVLVDHFERLGLRLCAGFYDDNVEDELAGYYYISL